MEGDRTLTWGEYIDRRNRLAHSLVKRGLSLPRDAAGKLIKRQLRDPYWAGRAARI